MTESPFSLATQVKRTGPSYAEQNLASFKVLLPDSEVAACGLLRSGSDLLSCFKLDQKASGDPARPRHAGVGSPGRACRARG